MKRLFSIFVICLLSFNLFSVDLSKVKIGDSKSQVIKQFGTPLKEIKNGKFEYDVWTDKKDIWLCSLENEKVATEPMLLDDFLNSLLDLSNAFSALGALNLSDTSDSSTSTVSSSTTSTKTKNESETKVDKSLLKTTEITFLESTIINKDFNPKAGFRLKIKNNGQKEITKLRVIIYFYDKKGKVFFDKEVTLIAPDLYSFPNILKPNYSVMVPESSLIYIVAEGMDIDEWDEGKVSFEVVELK